MLQFIRDRAQGWLAWLIIGLLIIPFALWGINQYFQGGGDANVATVNGTEISLQKYQQAYQQQRNRIRSMLGKNASADLLDSLVKPKDVINGLIENELLLQTVVDSGFRVSDQLLAQQIQSIEAFQQNGKFSKELYSQLVRNQGDSLPSFEARMHRSTLINQLRSGVVDTSIVTNKDVDQYIRLDKQKRAISYVVIPAANYLNDANVSDAQIEEYYQSHRDQYMNPEQVSINYIELSASDLAKKQADPTSEELRALYDEHKDEFGVGEERKARHILIQVKDQNNKEEVKKAEEKANDLLKRIKQGESFEKLAKEFSEDPGSASKGGDLGFFGRGTMEQSFEDAAFALKKGEVSGVIKTSFGFHIIKLEDIHPATRKTLDQVRPELVQMFHQRKAETQFQDQSETLANVAYEQPDSLVPAAEALGLTVRTSGMFSRTGGKEIAANPKVVSAAFSQDVLKKGFNSEPIEIGNNQVVVLRVKEHKEASQRGLEEVKEEIHNLLKHDMASEKAQANGKDMVSRLKKGESSETIANELKIKWNKPEPMSRNEHKIDRKIVDFAFSMARPSEGKAVTSGLKLNNGDYSVIQLLSVIDGDPSKVEASERKSVEKKLADIYSNSEFEDFVAGLKKQATITIHQENLK